VTDAGNDGPTVDGGAGDAPNASDSGSGPAFYVFKKMFVGDSDRLFKQGATAWRTYGDDIDGKVTATQSTDVCQRAQGAPPSMQADGDNGIDNSFGANILPILVAAGLASPSLQWSQATQQGATRPVLLRVDGLAPASADAPASLYIGAIPPGPPSFDGTGTWPVSSLSVDALDLTKPKVRLAKGAVQAGVWRTEPATTAASLYMKFDNGTLVLPIRHLALRASLSMDGKTLDQGQISGVMKTDELVEAVRQAVAVSSPSLCMGAAWDSIAAQLRQAQDILVDGTQNASAPCDAISIGLGFEGATMGLGAAKDDPGPSKPCP
jgi:hypothetical protein